MTESAQELRLVELTLRKPKLGWYPKPTVTVDGVAQPTQWGTRNWKVRGNAELSIYLHNRLWTFGQATISLEPGESGPLQYRAPWLPFLPGRLTRK